MKQYVLALFFFLSLLTHGQDKKVIIQFTNSINDFPIEDLSVVVLDNKGELLTIQASNDLGKIELFLPIGNYRLKTSHLGYQNSDFEIQVSGTLNSFKLSIIPLVQELDEVLLESYSSITKNGDTTTIRLSRYKNGKERNVLDLLKKLPKVKVEVDGTIIYKGKAVTNVLINGNRIFDNDYKSVLDKVSPYEMVSVQFIENYKGTTNSSEIAKDKMALNMQFSKDFFITGGAEIGVGIENTRLIKFDLLQNSRILTSVAYLNFQNLENLSGIRSIKSDDQFFYNKSLLNSISDLNLNEIDQNMFLDFNETLDSRLTQKIRLSDNSTISLNTSYLSESSFRETNIFTNFNINDDIIFRKETSSSKYEVESINSDLGYFFKTSNLILDTEFSFFQTNKNNHLNISLNEQSNFRDFILEDNIFTGKLKLEKTFSDTKFLDIQSGLLIRGSSELIVNEGILPVSQDRELNEYSIFFLGKYISKLRDSLTLTYALDFDFSSFDQNNFYSSFNFNDYDKLSNATIPVKLNFKNDRKEWHISPSAHLFSYSNSKGKNENNFKLGIETDYKFESDKGWNHKVTLNSSPQWITTDRFNSRPLFVEYNILEAFSDSNEAIQVSVIDYKLTFQKGLSQYFLGFSINHNSKSLATSLNINEDFTSSRNTVISDDNEIFKANINFNTLLWKEYFLEFDLSYQDSYGFLSTGSDPIQKINSNILTIKSELNRRLSRKIYLGVSSEASRNQLYFNSTRNDVWGYNVKSKFVYDLNQIEFEAAYNYYKIGLNNGLNLINFNFTYVPKNSRFTFFLQGTNLLNEENFRQSNITNISFIDRSTNLPDLRLTGSIKYSF